MRRCPGWYRAGSDWLLKQRTDPMESTPASHPAGRIGRSSRRSDPLGKGPQEFAPIRNQIRTAKALWCSEREPWNSNTPKGRRTDRTQAISTLQSSSPRKLTRRSCAEEQQTWLEGFPALVELGRIAPQVSADAASHDRAEALRPTDSGVPGVGGCGRAARGRVRPRPLMWPLP